MNQYLPASQTSIAIEAVACLLISFSAAIADDAPRRDLAEYDRLIKCAQRNHWAFQPVTRPEIPAVRTLPWPRNPIDAFVLKKLESRGWQPAPSASPQALLRRIYLNVIGLPPTPGEQHAFENDASPTAWDNVVDGLLARPQYGERLGRHWLD